MLKKYIEHLPLHVLIFTMSFTPFISVSASKGLPPNKKE